ncbi:hypothetical protein GCM10009531_44220 [Actinoplanes capillaceus]
MIIRLHFAIEVRKNSFMRQGSLFSRAHIAEMRDHAKARNHSPEREEFRRAQQRRRAFGLERRHAEKLRRLRRDGAAAPTPTDPNSPVASAVPSAASAVSPVAPAAPPVAPAVPPVVAAPRTRPAERCAPDNRRSPSVTEFLCATATAAPVTRARSTQHAAPRQPAGVPDSGSVGAGQATARGVAASPKTPTADLRSPRSSGATPVAAAIETRDTGPTACSGEAEVVPLTEIPTTARRPLALPAAKRQPDSGYGHRSRPDDPLFEAASSRMSPASTRSRPQRRPVLRRCRLHLSPPHKTNGRTTEYKRYPNNF